MLHNPKRIRGIEVWSRRLAWVYLVYILVGSLILIATSINSPAASDQYFSAGFSTDLLQTFGKIIPWIHIPVSTAAVFLLLIGVSLVTQLLRLYYAAISKSE